jgi:hypothetical protein
LRHPLENGHSIASRDNFYDSLPHGVTSVNRFRDKIRGRAQNGGGCKTDGRSAPGLSAAGSFCCPYMCFFAGECAFLWLLADLLNVPKSRCFCANFMLK